MTTRQINPAALQTVAGLLQVAEQYLDDSANPQLAPLALSFLQKALRLEPNNISIRLMLGKVHYWLGDNSQALECAAAAQRIDPDALAPQVALTMWQIPLFQESQADIDRCRENYCAALEKLATLIDTSSPQAAQAAAKALAFVVPTAFAYQGYDVTALQAIYGRLAVRVAASTDSEWTFAPAVELPGPDQRIRVGVASMRFTAHPDWRMITGGWLGQLDPRRFELFCYSLNPNDSPEAEFARQRAAKFVEGDFSRSEWAALIRSDKLHALIYPEVGVNKLPKSLAALRLAPVQCAAWGATVTTGLPTVDYYLSSELMEPPGAQAHYSEKLILLPNLSNYLQPRPYQPEPVTRAAFGLRDDAVVFLCDQHVIKYLPAYDDLIASIAERVPGCQFVFHGAGAAEAIVNRLKKRQAKTFAARGLDAAAFIVWRRALEWDRYQSLCGLCDVFLDSVGYSGCTTTVEAALPHNLPVVTVAGEFARGRQSLAILRRIGVTATIAADNAEFVEIAVRLGNDPAYRRVIAAQIRANRHKIYGDMAAIQALEAFLEHAVHRVPLQELRT